MHLGAFEGIEYGDAQSDVDKVGKFLAGFASQKKTPQVIVYSRQGFSTLKEVKSYIAKTNNDYAESVVLVAMEQGQGFEIGESNRDRIEKALVRVMQLDRLYTRTIQ
jgi:hypothetical protein